jgi:hypothetical protein
MKDVKLVDISGTKRDLCRDINDFNKVYQPRTNIIKDERGDLLRDFYSILARWGNPFSATEST